MGPKRILGIALIIAGAIAAFMGYQESQGIASSINNVVEGSPGDSVMIKYIGGAVSVVVGAFLTKG